MTWMRGQLSAQDTEAIKRQLANKDLDIKPRPYVPKPNSADRADWERVGQQFLSWLRS
jgi:hypothetical protein